jgi:hypothetical protein
MEQLEHLQASQFYGRGVEHMFPQEASTAPTPWPTAHRYRDTRPYDEERVRQTLMAPPQLQEIDPRNLHSTQPSITRSGVEYYSNPPMRAIREQYTSAFPRSTADPTGVATAGASSYQLTGRTYEETKGMGTNEGNRFPVIYRREADPRAYSNEPQNLILSGHHRAAAALAAGRPLRARIVEGPWGAKR